jgi:hypothetical protein
MIRVIRVVHHDVVYEAVHSSANTIRDIPSVLSHYSDDVPQGRD